MVVASLPFPDLPKVDESFFAAPTVVSYVCSTKRAPSLAVSRVGPNLLPVLTLRP